MDTIGFLSEKFAKIKEKYGDNYPILLLEPHIDSKDNKTLKDIVSRNSSTHLFSELENAFKFAQSLGISFILIVPREYEELKLIQGFKKLQHIYERRMLDFEEGTLLKDIFKGVSDQVIKNLKVYVICTLFDCLTESPIKDDEEEVMALCDIKDIAKQFRQEFIVIWYDPDINPEIQVRLEEEIEIKIEAKNMYTEFEDLHERIKNYSGTPYHLIMSRSEKAEKILNEINKKNDDLLGVYVYCKNEKQIDDEKVEIQRTLDELIPRIKEGIRTRSKLKYGFPAFATNFDSSDRTGMNKLHYYLKGLKNFYNRKQAKEDFIKLARKIYQDQKKELVRFEERYNAYNREEIFRWYTKDSPVYKLINNCLRISSSDSILYCRLILKDLERAIREQYQETSRDLDGVVYRGAYISTKEWEKLERNIGQEIEMYGFLSTTVNQKTAMRFLKSDPKNKILIKIVIPPLPEEDEQGFADISKFSDSQIEQEILFNVRSKFRILEAGVSKIDGQGTKCRQLVLLYGVQSLRRYMTRLKPLVEVKLELPNEIICILCGSKEKLFGFQQQGGTFVNCLQCLVKGSMPKDNLLVALHGEKDREIAKVMQGVMLKPKKGVAFANSGYVCHACKDSGKARYYKWLSCDGTRVLIECSECLENCKNIQDRILLSESSAYIMWQESQDEWETISSDYQVDLLQKMDLGNLAHIYVQTEDHTECLNYAKRILEKNIKRRRREIFRGRAFFALGEAFSRLGEDQQAIISWENGQNLLKFSGQEKSMQGIFIHYQLGMAYLGLAKHKEGLEYFHRALDIGRDLFKEMHQVTAVIYHGIASAYVGMNEFKNALDFFIKSLEIKKSVLGARHPVTADGYQSLGLLYQSLGRYQEALKVLTLALEIHESVHGENHSQTALSYFNLALLEIDLGEYQKAIKLLNKAIDIQKSIYQRDHPAIAASFKNLAEVYKTLGQYQEAIKYFQKAFDIDTSFYGEKHPSTASYLSNLGSIWQQLGDYQKALHYSLKYQEHIKSCFGEKHHDIAASYANIGSIYYYLGEFKKALEYGQKGLDLLETIFEGPHQSKAALYNNMAAAYGNLGEHQKALGYHEKALEMNISLHGERHSHVTASYNNIGKLYISLEEHSKAIKYLKKAVEIRKLVFEEQTPENALSYNNLAFSYQSLGDFQRAFEYYKKAIAIQEIFHPGDHPATATFYHNLGGAYSKMGEYSKAREYLKKALKMRKAILPENYPDFGHGYNSFGLLYRRLGETQRAQKYYSKAIALFETLYGETHPLTANSYESIGTIYITLGKREEAIKYKKKSLMIRQIIYGENNVIVAKSYNNLGSCYLSLGDYQESINNFFKGIEVVEAYGGKNHPDASQFYENLFSVYSTLGDSKKASKYFEKASIAKGASTLSKKA